MAFTWTTLTAGVTTIQKSHFQELVDNIQIAETSLQMTAGEKHTWTAGMNPFIKEIVDDADSLEIRVAVDSLDDNNICKTYYGSYHPGKDATLHSTYHGSKYVTYYADHHSSRESSWDGTDYGSYDGTDKGTDYGSRNSGNNSSYGG